MSSCEEAAHAPEAQMTVSRLEQQTMPSLIIE
jgi:hypothetical protein